VLNTLLQVFEKIGGPGRDRTDGLFHAMEAERQPEIDSKVVSNRNIGQKRVYRAIFPANFRPNFQCTKQPSCMGGGSAHDNPFWNIKEHSKQLCALIGSQISSPALLQRRCRLALHLPAEYQRVGCRGTLVSDRSGRKVVQPGACSSKSARMMGTCTFCVVAHLCLMAIGNIEHRRRGTPNFSDCILMFTNMHRWRASGAPQSWIRVTQGFPRLGSRLAIGPPG
jgi:hypothetical protein